jgi:hypothetical protein
MNCLLRRLRNRKANQPSTTVRMRKLRPHLIREIIVDLIAAEMNAPFNSNIDRGFNERSNPHWFKEKSPSFWGIFGKFSVKNRFGDDGHRYRTCYFFVPLNLDDPLIMQQRVRIQLSGQETTQVVPPAV